MSRRPVPAIMRILGLVGAFAFSVAPGARLAVAQTGGVAPNRRNELDCNGYSLKYQPGCANP